MGESLENSIFSAQQKPQGWGVARPTLAERRSPWEPTALLDFGQRRATRNRHRDGCVMRNNKPNAAAMAQFWSEKRGLDYLD
ncbi:MAG TPA: hypothetical protein VGP99_05410 [Tepidisphaeraceae bacterium]|jgi:hypothetical protein|nr:hypothetical protein [Tepidisphaeraceae bacterium]